MQIPVGQRPLRSVVGPQFTDGVPEYNQAYEQLRAHMAEVLRRPDQAVTGAGQICDEPLGSTPAIGSRIG